MMDDMALDEISAILVEARRSAGSLNGFPGELPGSAAEAYSIQHRSRRAWQQEVAGWKVGGIPAAQAERLGSNFLAGPIFAPTVQQAKDGVVSAMPIFADGFAAIEPELVVQLGETRAEDRLFIGVEIASSPIVGINGIGAVVVMSDFGNNHGLLVGPEITDWSERQKLPVTVHTFIDDTDVGMRTIDDPAAHIAGPRDFLLQHAAEHDIALPAGTYISTGAITGIHEATVGARSHISFGDLGALDLELVKAEPEA